MQAEKIELYGAPTGNCARAAIALEEAGLPYRPRMVDLRRGEHFQHDFLRLNDAGKVPVLIDATGEAPITLSQSNAIVFHAAERAPGTLIPMADAAARALTHERYFYFLTDVIALNHAAFLMGGEPAARGLTITKEISMQDRRLQVEAFFDEATSTISYVVIDRPTRMCAIVDTVLDYDPKSGRTSHQSADRLIARVRELGLRVEWILETHVHADHLSAAPYIRDALGGRLAIGNRIKAVQEIFGALFNEANDFARDGSQFDHLLSDGETFSIGGLTGRAIHTPGHTPACMTYVIGEGGGPGHPDAAFVGDTLFMPDYGSARCDFPGGDAKTLYRSIRKVLSLAPETQLYMCHDYRPAGRELRFISSVAQQRAENIHVRDGIGEDDFVAMRTARDATLGMPVLILPSVQVNMRAGDLPPPESNGTRYIKIPLDRL